MCAPQVDDGPERVLVLGWGAQSLMADLIKELDHGLSALPAGSEVVFVNTHSADETLGAVLQNTTLEYIKVSHATTGPERHRATEQHKCTVLPNSTCLPS